MTRRWIAYGVMLTGLAGCELLPRDDARLQPEPVVAAPIPAPIPIVLTPPAPEIEAAGPVQVGLASWYGGRHHGRKTASGGRFDRASFTAAHPTLPFGSEVRVTNLANDKSLILTVTDRGPRTRDRIIDVSETAATQLDMRRSGVARVRVEPLPFEPPAPRPPPAAPAPSRSASRTR